MRKKIATNCKGCKANEPTYCSLGYERLPNICQDIAPLSLCPKPTTDKALKKEMRK
jgi:hypothetical protein